MSPGGRFDPLGLAGSGDLEELKIKELKHCRLSMFAWLGCIPGLATQEGRANWQAHVADPVHARVTNAASDSASTKQVCVSDDRLVNTRHVRVFLYLWCGFFP